MPSREQILQLLNDELTPAVFPDASLNGLQVAGRESISTVAVAVDAAEETINRAAAAGADLLLVHHGLFWGEPIAVTGAHRRRLAALLEANLNLYVAHLPLDAHPRHGNNACLARVIQMENYRSAFDYRGQPIGCLGANSAGLTVAEIEEELKKLPGSAPTFLSLRFGPETPQR
ncbi:MAG: Nif3-like dinuclear metal center hexameric protein, partial [Bdellovibrionales bacterium]|nr:Nif3-like dinuclear metal center hexameric protein [Bdellovibrionales bacterium]